mmetsp:Transcript_4333/g.12106  ORF Transcript_4333/g.12106 Transcript_4333/m.12106 type:complete len:267 (-) Transcript_4333:767-1567(-)
MNARSETGLEVSFTSPAYLPSPHAEKLRRGRYESLHGITRNGKDNVPPTVLPRGGESQPQRSPGGKEAEQSSYPIPRRVLSRHDPVLPLRPLQSLRKLGRHPPQTRAGCRRLPLPVRDAPREKFAERSGGALGRREDGHGSDAGGEGGVPLQRRGGGIIAPLGLGLLAVRGSTGGIELSAPPLALLLRQPQRDLPYPQTGTAHEVGRLKGEQTPQDIGTFVRLAELGFVLDRQRVGKGLAGIQEARGVEVGALTIFHNAVAERRRG